MSKLSRHVKSLIAVISVGGAFSMSAEAQRLDPIKDSLRLESRTPKAPWIEPSIDPVDPVPARPILQGVTVHLASYYTLDDALRGWDILSGQHAELERWRDPILADADLGDRGIFVRLLAGPLPTRAEADQLCDVLNSAGAYCVPASLAGEFLPALDGSDG